MVSSAGGLLAMLNESHPQLKLHALSNLNTFVDYFWPEISTSVPVIESLYEDEEFDQRQLAALVASKVFYHLGEHNVSLSYALGAGPLLTFLRIPTMFIRFLLKHWMNMQAIRLGQLSQMKPQRWIPGWSLLWRECLISV